MDLRIIRSPSEGTKELIKRRMGIVMSSLRPNSSEEMILISSLSIRRSVRKYSGSRRCVIRNRKKVERGNVQ